MGDDVPIGKLKAAELKSLAKGMGLHLTGKEKKNEVLSLIEGRLEEKLNTLAVDELKPLAAGLAVALPDSAGTPELVKAIKPKMTERAARDLLAPPQQHATEPEPSPAEELGEIASELIDVETDLLNVVQKLEHIPAPDMADLYLIDQKLSDVVKSNIDFGNVASMLDVGRIKFLDRKYMESISILKEAVKASEDMVKQYSDITHAFIILSAEKILEECRESNSNNEEAADLLIRAKRRFSEGGKSRAESVQAVAEVANTVYREEVVFLEERIAKVEPLISAMKVQGVDVFNAERYTHRAREAFLMGELASVNANLDRALHMANESKDAWIQDIKSDIPRVESVLAKAKELGADISEAEKHLSQAKTAFNNRDYPLCSELKKIAERKANESRQLQIQKAAMLGQEMLAEAEKILATLTPLIREAEAYGLNISDIMGLAQNAKNALMSQDYVNALTFARDAESKSKAIWTQVKAQREGILAGGEPLQQCQACKAMGVKVFPRGKAVCANCGMVYDIQVRTAPEPKKGWFKR